MELEIELTLQQDAKSFKSHESTELNLNGMIKKADAIITN